MMTTQKHVSVITGASKGIGMATAHRLKTMGHQVIGLARRQPEQPFPGELIKELVRFTLTQLFKLPVLSAGAPRSIPSVLISSSISSQ
jgi:NAD(P)-dependent dehydrogenase (short-subunit alcohol dehydrogenase family)